MGLFSKTEKTNAADIDACFEQEKSIGNYFWNDRTLTMGTEDWHDWQPQHKWAYRKFGTEPFHIAIVKDRKGLAIVRDGKVINRLPISTVADCLKRHELAGGGNKTIIGTATMEMGNFGGFVYIRVTAQMQSQRKSPPRSSKKPKL